MKEFRQNIQHNNLVLLKLANRYGLISSLDPVALNKINNFFPLSQLNDFCILIGDIGQLYDYVDQVPQIAWDIVEFEENALIIKYPKGKNLPTALHLPDQGVKIMLLKNHPLEKPLYNYGKGVFFNFNLAAEIVDQNLTHFDYVLNLSQSQFNLFDPKTMQLGLNGEVKFL